MISKLTSIIQGNSQNRVDLAEHINHRIGHFLFSLCEYFPVIIKQKKGRKRRKDKEKGGRKYKSLQRQK